MLIALTKKDFTKYVDWAYELALDISRSAYPTYTDGIKTKQDFTNIALKSFSDPNREILLFEHGGQTLGWIDYYTIPQDKYIALEAFNTEKYAPLALKEFETYCKNKFCGYTLYLGFPSENKEAVYYFKDNGYTLLETSYPNIFHFGGFTPLKCNEKIIEINADSYFLFEELHKNVDGDMYWNTQKILENLSNWHIFYYSDGKIQGAIYFTGGKIMEIFGVDFLPDSYSAVVFEKLLAKCMNACFSLGADHLYYFCEKHECEILLKLGFKSLGEYNLYTLYLT